MPRSRFVSSAQSWALVILIVALVVLLLGVIQGRASPQGDDLAWWSGSADAPVVSVILEEPEWTAAAANAQRRRSATLLR